MQLSIQAYAQQQAKELIQSWGKQARVHIGNVRYHLLRNGLILQNIRIERGDDKVTIKHILVRANPKLLTSSTPRIDSMDISDFEAEFSNAGDLHIWQQDDDLKHIWQATTSLTVHNGQIRLYPKGKGFPPLILHNLSLQQLQQASARTVTGSAKLLQGSLNWQWQMTTGTQETATHQATGTLAWQGLDAGQLMASLALKHLEGHLNGELTWNMEHGDVQQQTLNMQGKIQLHTGQGRQTLNPHSLQLTATRADDLWNMDMTSIAWPLDPWSDTLPGIAGRQLVSAQLDSTSHWQGRPGHWKINSAEGGLQDVVFARSTGQQQSGWYWSQINYAKAGIDTARNRLHLSSIDMIDSRLALQAKTAMATEMADARDSSSLPALSEKDVPWNINVDHINIDNMALALETAQGKVVLETLDGKAQCPKGKPLSFKLHTINGKTSLSPDEDSPLPPQWQLRGKAEKNKQGALVSAGFKVSGRHIPIARLRPLLPVQDDISRPVKLAGEADLTANVTVQQGSWQMQGKAAIQDFGLSHGGNSWRAKELALRFGPVGMGLKTQKIHSIKSQDWQYTAALHPLPPQTPATPDADMQNNTETVTPFWWEAMLRSNNIEIGSLDFRDGKISVGQQQSVWVDQVNIKIDTLKEGHWSDISVRGKTGGGDFHLDGQWNALSDHPRFRGKIILAQATPFFLHNWMIASGMPRLIRGRLSARLSITDGHAPNSYQSKVNIRLLQGQTETGTFPSDPMLARTGYNTSELLQRLNQHTGAIALQYDLTGQWEEQPLNMERLGLALQETMQQTARAATIVDGKETTVKTATEARIRLHDQEQLSQNERIRLFKVVRKMRRHPDMIIELRARWTGKEDNEQRNAEIQRILRTQQLIERYMVYRKISRGRIFPVWPTVEDSSDETGSIQVVTSNLPARKVSKKKSRH